MARRRAIALSGLAAAVLVNYWVVALIVGVDHDPAFSWISDLAARGEAGGWRFALLDGLSGFAVVCFGVLLWREPARPADDSTGVPRSHILDSGSPVTVAPGRTVADDLVAAPQPRIPASGTAVAAEPGRTAADNLVAASQPGIPASGAAVAAAPGGSALRWGLILLITSGALAIADALLPVSCARSLGAGCVRAGDLVDGLHEVESALAVLATGAAMVLVGIGLRGREGWRWIVALSLLAGVAFLLLSGLIALRESADAFNDYKGWLQRGGQLTFGIWLAALGFAASGRLRDQWPR